MDNNDKKSFGVDIKPEVAKGVYSNLALITHSHSEFIVDFGASLPGFQKPAIVSRIAMTPYHATRCLLALQDNMIKYESAFGDVDLEAANPRQKGTFNFNDFGKNGNGENKSQEYGGFQRDKGIPLRRGRSVH